MSKVAILTTHRANNFGAVLQTYSLVKAVCEMGAEGYILDWRCPYYEWLYHSAWRMRYNPIIALKHLAHFIRYENAVRSKFDAFRSLMPMTNSIWRHSELSNAIESFNSVIVGSDQVWNPINSTSNPLNFDRSYLLDFVLDPSKKFSYAASIGVEEIEPKSLLPEFENAWKTFKLITTREKRGAQYVTKIAQCEAYCVLDPVLLHDADYWAGIESPLAIEGPFVFDYNILHDPVLDAALNAYAHEKNLRVVRPLIPGQVYRPDEHTLFMGPLEFVWALHHADCVFTTSFHASAFSLIFNKRLIIRKRPGKGTSNTRFDIISEFSAEEPNNFKDGVQEFDLSHRKDHELRVRQDDSRDWLMKML